MLEIITEDSAATFSDLYVDPELSYLICWSRKVTSLDATETMAGHFSYWSCLLSKNDKLELPQNTEQWIAYIDLLVC